MEFRQLLCFERVADLGSMTRAAEALHLAQPAVSQHIATLEREVGMQLFQRGSRGVKLTAAGEALLPHARRALAEVDRASQVLGDLRNVRAGRVSIGLTPSAVLWLLPTLLERFRQQYPHVEIRVVEDMTDALVDALHGGQLDLATVSMPLDDDRLEVRPLYEERLALIVGPDHELAAAHEVDLATLADSPWILPYRRHGVRALLESACGQAGFELHPVVEMSGLGPIKQLVQRGLGISVVPPAIVENEVRLGQLRLIPITRPVLMRAVGVARRRGESPTPAAKAMESVVRAVAQVGQQVP